MSWAHAFGKLRTIAPIVGGYASSILAAWAAKKGFAISNTEAAAIVAGGGHVLTTVIGALGVNPNGANAPSMVRTEPLAPPLTELEVPAPIDIPADNAERMRAAFGPPNPLIAANAAKMAEINAAAVCVLCGKEGGHKDWCSKTPGGSGIAPTGEFDDTRTFKRAVMQKIADQMDAAVAVAMQEREPAEKSRILKPKPNAAPEPAAKSRARKKNAPSDVVKVGRRATDAPRYSEGDPRGFADYVPTGKDLPKNISPRPRLSKNDKGVL